MSALRAGALFAGYGGLTMGIAQVLDVELAWYCETDPAMSAVMAHHHPGVPNLGDVTKVDWRTVEPVDVIEGGSPCQDLSGAGNGAGMRAGTRSGLWWAMHESIRIIRPRLVAWENVRGAYRAPADSNMEPCPRCVGDADTASGLRALGRVLGDLAGLGFDAGWYGLPASDVGAPHPRFRVFVYASPADADGSGQREQRWPLAIPAEHSAAEYASAHPRVTLLPTPAVNDMGEGKTLDWWDTWTAAQRAKHGNGNGHGKSLAVEAMRLLPTPKASPSGPDYARATRPGSGGDDLVTAVARGEWGQYGPAIERWEHIIDRPAPAPVDDEGRLSALLPEWMMGLPAGHVTGVPGITRRQALRGLGNGVVPQQAAAALRAYLRDSERITR